MTSFKKSLLTIAATATIVTGIAVIDAAGPALAVDPPIATLPTANPANFTPNVLNGEVDSIWQIGNRVIIGGTFTRWPTPHRTAGTVYNRNRSGRVQRHDRCRRHGVRTRRNGDVVDGDHRGRRRPRCTSPALQHGQRDQPPQGRPRQHRHRPLITSFNASGVNGSRPRHPTGRRRRSTSPDSSRPSAASREPSWRRSTPTPAQCTPQAQPAVRRACTTAARPTCHQDRRHARRRTGC